MGYYADHASGGKIIIDNPTATLEKMKEIEKTNGVFLWDSVDSFVDLARVTYTEEEEVSMNAVNSLLLDYGFITEIDHTNGHVIIESWNGEKISSRWELVWQAIGAGVTVEETSHWIMRGEDGAHWCEVVGNGLHNTYDVAVNYEINA
jgi:hypothetical protein